LADDAKISIINGEEIFNDFKIEYADSTKRNKYYTNDGNLFIEPNTVYSIIIESNGQTINGNLKTIGDFEILSIDKNDYEEEWQSIINIKWKHCENAVFYIIKINYFYSYIFPEDTLEGLRGEYLEMFKPDILKSAYSREINITKPDSLTAEVEAYDQNGYDYYIKKIKKVGIENAYGYLGSSTIRKWKLYF
jgi:hypothetical protein